MFSLLVAGEEELVVPPWPTAFAQWTLGRALEELVIPIVLPDGDEPFWVQREEAVIDDLILSCKLVQFEDVIVMITVVFKKFEMPVQNEGGEKCDTHAQYVLYHQLMTFGRPPKKEPRVEGEQHEPGETKPWH